jgi:hypothetical protein
LTATDPTAYHLIDGLDDWAAARGEFVVYVRHVVGRSWGSSSVDHLAAAVELELARPRLRPTGLEVSVVPGRQSAPVQQAQVLDRPR